MFYGLSLGGERVWIDGQAYHWYLILDSDVTTKVGKIVTKHLSWTEYYHDCDHLSMDLTDPRTMITGSITTYDPYWGRWWTYNNEIWIADARKIYKDRYGDSIKPAKYVEGNYVYTNDGRGEFTIEYEILQVDKEGHRVQLYNYPNHRITWENMLWVFKTIDVGELEIPPMPSEISDSELFANAVDEIRGLNQNMIANVLAIKDFAKQGSEKLMRIGDITGYGDLFDLSSLVTGVGRKKNPINPKRLLRKSWEKAGDKWLQYRYELCTTMSDLDELRHKLNSAMDNIVTISHGSMQDLRLGATATLNDVSYSLTGYYSCTMHNNVQKLWYSLDQLGLQPNLVNVWDLIPYSFVVDWFLPMGEYFAHIDRAFLFGNKSLSQEIYSCPYKIHDLFVSTKESYYVDVGDDVQAYAKVYHRRCLEHVPTLLYYKDSYEPSMKVWIKRILDSAALFIHF